MWVGIMSVRQLKHEIRTPINHLVGSCELLLGEFLEEGAVDRLKDAEMIFGLGKDLLRDVDLTLSPLSDDASVSPDVLERLGAVVRKSVSEIQRAELCNGGSHQSSGQPGHLADIDRICKALTRLMEFTANNGARKNVNELECQAELPGSSRSAASRYHPFS